MNSPDEETLCLIDTNVWLYALLPNQDPDKSVKAKDLVRQTEVVISTQIINEVCINLIKKAAFDEQQIQQLIDSFYQKYTVVMLDKPVLHRASALRRRWQLSFWDSLVTASALLAGARILYSEDMHNGLVVEGSLTLVNPFSL